MSISRSIKLSLALIALASASVLGCAEPMDPASMVNELRVLAIRADPPEIAPGEGTSLTALWADPKGRGRDVTFLWIAAAGLVDLEGGFPDTAPLAAPQVATAAEGGDHYEIPVTSEGIIEQFALAGENAVNITILTLACAGGVPPTIDDLTHRKSLDLKSDLCRGGQGVLATKVVRVSKSKTPNENPTIDTVWLAGKAIPEETADLAIASCTKHKACKDIKLKTSLSSSSFETYPANETMHGATGKLDENLYISWFATAGDLDKVRSIPDSPDKPAVNQLDLAADDPDSLTLYIVAHDNRGGTSWRTLSLSR
jgi:hypothetical protein